MRYAREWNVKIEDADPKAETAKGVATSAISGARITFDLGKREYGHGERALHARVVERGKGDRALASSFYGSPQVPRAARNAILRAVERQLTGVAQANGKKAKTAAAMTSAEAAAMTSAAERTLLLPFPKAAPKPKKKAAAKKRKPAKRKSVRRSKPAKRVRSSGDSKRKAKKARKPSKAKRSKKGARRAKR